MYDWLTLTITFVWLTTLTITFVWLTTLTITFVWLTYSNNNFKKLQRDNWCKTSNGRWYFMSAYMNKLFDDLLWYEGYMMKKMLSIVCQ